MTNPTPPNASPQPILPGVPHVIPSDIYAVIPKPCWLWSDTLKVWWYYGENDARLSSDTHYLVAPATADPATFPKADEPKLCVHALPLHECEQMECRIRSLKDSPSAGTEQKERGEWLCTHCKETVPAEHVTFHESHDVRAGGCGHKVSPAAPTDGTTTPRTNGAVLTAAQVAKCHANPPTQFANYNEFVRADIARTLERERNAWLADATELARERDDLTARLALTEKRLGEAQKTLGGDTINEMADLFLSWPLPYSVCSDICVTKQTPGRIGTSLLNVHEAREMIRAVVGPYLSERRHKLELENTGLAGEIEKLKARNARLEETLTAANYGDVPAGWDAAIERAEKSEAALSTSQARLVEVEAAFATQQKNYTGLYAAVMGDGTLTAELHDPCAVARALRSALAQAKQEEATLRERMQAVADAADVESKQLLRANTALSAQVEELKRDGERMEELRKALCDYIDYLYKADAASAGFLMAHNWHHRHETLTAGSVLREIIADKLAAIESAARARAHAKQGGQEEGAT